MATVDQLVGDIEAAPAGPSVIAAFDYDGTIIAGFSAEAFYKHRFRTLDMGPLELARTAWAAVRGIDGDEAFESFFAESIAAWEGRSEEEMETLGQKLFDKNTADRLHVDVWRLIEAHHRRGHRIVLCSSATRFQVEPMAQAMGAEHVLCSAVEVRDGVLTGQIPTPPLWGENKLRALRALADEHELDLAEAFAYSNGTEDIPFLAAAGHAAAVEPEPGLEAEAEKRGWPVLRCPSRGRVDELLDGVRTGGFYAAMAGAFGVGASLGLANRSRDTLVELTGGIGSDVGLAISGVNVEVVSGREHLWSARPAVFVFNHQSNIDAIVIMKLLRQRFTGVAKAEAKRIPGFGQFFQLAGVAFVDRDRSKKAVEALGPAVDKITKDGLSMAIAPEGTRAPTPQLGRFKKGAFHIAMEAGVPMVPIVIRNGGEILPNNSETIRPGTIEVVVLPPFDTSGWSADTIDDHVSEVRGAFAHTLRHFPEGPPRPALERETAGAAP